MTTFTKKHSDNKMKEIYFGVKSQSKTKSDFFGTKPQPKIQDGYDMSLIKGIAKLERKNGITYLYMTNGMKIRIQN